MQIVDCMVAIGGDARMSVLRQNVTIAELVVLQEVHGRSSITDVKLVGELRNFNPVAHRDVLKERYELTEQSPKIAVMFPGVTPQMPRKLEEVLLVDPEDNGTASNQNEGDIVRFDAGGELLVDEDPDLDDDGDLDPEPEDEPEGVVAPVADAEPAAEPAANPFEG